MFGRGAQLKNESGPHIQAATGAGMRCMITYTSSTESEDFEGAERVVSALDKADPPISIEDIKYAKAAQDDRKLNVA